MNKPTIKKIGIFGGTQEGRLLAEFCRDEDIDFAVSVATAYGEQILENTAIWGGKVHAGRMNAQEMAQWITREAITAVVDATHPFARAVSKEIRSACIITKTEYLRLLREETEEKSSDAFFLSWVSSFEEAAARLKQELLCSPEKKALLTVGSKELACFAAEKALLPRIFVRVLPSVEAIKTCQDAGFYGKQIIAMQGPFSTELNKALIRTVQASFLVTKESGKTGGFEEKIRAARECGCQVIAIKRPKEHNCEEDEHGKSLEEIKQWLSKEKHRKNNTEHPQESAEYIQKTKEHIQKTTKNIQKTTENIQKTAECIQKTKEHLPEITLLGIGTGSTGQITLDGLRAILRADAFLGASRMIESAKTMRRLLSDSKSIPPCPPDIHPDGKQESIAECIAYKDISSDSRQESVAECITYKKEEMLSWLMKHPKIKHPVILFSGDTGFYSGTKGVYELLRAEFPSALLCLLPGISSLSYFAAKIGRPWENTETVSFHGREEIIDWTFADKKERFFLLDGEKRLYQICQNLLKNRQENATLWVGENLSYPTEKIICGSPEKLLNMHFEKLLVAWVRPGGVSEEAEKLL